MWSAFSYYAILVFESIVGVVGIRLYEEPRYEVIERINDRVEVRRYAERLAAEVMTQASGDAGRSEAFRLLFAYIAGANKGSNEKIAMTVPVDVRDPTRLAMTVPVQAGERDGVMRMKFFLPAKYTEANVPAPTDPRVVITKVPGETLAILRYSGSGKDFAKRQGELLQVLAGSSWRPAGQPFALSYDAPFTIPIFRRNEAAVAVEK